MHHDTVSSRPMREWMRAMNRMQPYRVQRSLWLALGSAVIISMVMLLAAIQPGTHRIQPEYHAVYTSVGNLVLFTLLYIYNFWLIRIGLRRWPLAGVGLLGSLVISTLFSMLSYCIEVAIYDVSIRSMVVTIIINSSSALITFLISMLLTNITEYQQTLLENEHLQAENMRIHHQTLEQQLSPHFLFNSLNTLDGLIGTDDARAHKYLQQLAATFRYTLQKQREVSLADELDFTHAYIYMMQIRYGGSLNIEEQIDPSLLHHHLPPISLQLLVENAIKHNVITSRRPLTVSITTTAEGRLRVSNPLQLKADQDPSEGIGLSNLEQRYQLLYGQHIDIESSDDTFAVEIPLIKA